MNIFDLISSDEAIQTYDKLGILMNGPSLSSANDSTYKNAMVDMCGDAPSIMITDGFFEKNGKVMIKKLEMFFEGETKNWLTSLIIRNATIDRSKKRFEAAEHILMNFGNIVDGQRVVGRHNSPWSLGLIVKNGGIRVSEYYWPEVRCNPVTFEELTKSPSMTPEVRSETGQLLNSVLVSKNSDIIYNIGSNMFMSDMVLASFLTMD